MESDFLVKTANIVAQVRIRTGIDEADVKALEELLKADIKEYYADVNTYGHSIGYDEGYKDSQDYGYSEGYKKGYALGYNDGYTDGRYADERPRQP